MPEESKNQGSDSGYSEAIKIVMSERQELTRIGSELLILLSQKSKESKSIKTTNNKIALNKSVIVQTKILELSQHLGNIAGFCDAKGKGTIFEITRLFDASMMSDLFYIQLHALLPSIIGIQVDFTKKPPFKVAKINLEGLGAKIEGMFKR